jgi:hypothetical protein
MNLQGNKHFFTNKGILVLHINNLDEVKNILNKVSQDEKIFVINDLGVNGKLLGFNIILLESKCVNHLDVFDFLFNLSLEYTFRDFIKDLKDKNSFSKGLKIIRFNLIKILERKLDKNISDFNNLTQQFGQAILI